MATDEKTSPAPCSIGFIGLGLMGLPVAERLATSGHIVHGHDIDAERRGLFGASNPNACVEPDLGAMAAACPVIITCLAGETVVTSVYEALCAKIGPGHTTIDLSTVPPDLARDTHAKVRATGAQHLEMPVIGIVDQARDGTLHGLASMQDLTANGDLPADLQAIVMTMTATQTIAGAPGAASTMKVLQNTLGLIQFAAIAEILGACEAMGISPKAFAEFVAAAPGMANSPLFRRIAPQMCDPAADPKTARLAIVAKDSRFGHELLRGAGARADLTAPTAALFAEAQDAGLGDVDHIHIADLYRKPRSP